MRFSSGELQIFAKKFNRAKRDMDRRFKVLNTATVHEKLGLVILCLLHAESYMSKTRYTFIDIFYYNIRSFFRLGNPSHLSYSRCSPICSGFGVKFTVLVAF